MKWQPIETAPKDGTELLLWLGKYGIAQGWWERGNEFVGWTTGWETGGTYDIGYARAYPTHWMPLPESPEPDNE